MRKAFVPPSKGMALKLRWSLFFCFLIPLADCFAVESGTYHCTPVHAVHYLARDDGTMSEQFVGNNNAMIVITVDDGSIGILDSRADERKSINIINNFAQGSVIGKSGSRQFYMDPVLHYFYGSLENEGAVAYAEEGRCRRF